MDYKQRHCLDRNTDKKTGNIIFLPLLFMSSYISDFKNNIKGYFYYPISLTIINPSNAHSFIKKLSSKIYERQEQNFLTSEKKFLDVKKKISERQEISSRTFGNFIADVKKYFPRKQKILPLDYLLYINIL